VFAFCVYSNLQVYNLIRIPYAQDFY